LKLDRESRPFGLRGVKFYLVHLRHGQWLALFDNDFTMNKYCICHFYIHMTFFCHAMTYTNINICLCICTYWRCPFTIPNSHILLFFVCLFVLFFLYSQYPNAEVVNFGTWFLFSFPISLIMLALTWLWMHWLFLGCKWVQDVQDVSITKTGHHRPHYCGSHKSFSSSND